jgi:hypothetical protein
VWLGACTLLCAVIGAVRANRTDPAAAKATAVAASTQT